MSLIAMSLLVTPKKSLPPPYVAALVTFDQPDGETPVAQVGQINVAGSSGVVCMGSKGKYSSYGGVVALSCQSHSKIGYGPWLFEYLWDCRTDPGVFPYIPVTLQDTQNSLSIFIIDGYNLYLFESDAARTRHVIDLSPYTRSNTICRLSFGRQQNMLQVWINGIRIFALPHQSEMAMQPTDLWLGSGAGNIYAMGTIIEARLLVGYELYGDQTTLSFAGM